MTGDREHDVESSFLGLGVDGVSPFQHLNKGLNLLFSTRLSLHVVEAKGQRVSVLRVELLKHLLGLGFGVDCREEIIRDRHLFGALVGSIPPPIGFRRLDLQQALFCHPPLLD